MQLVFKVKKLLFILSIILFFSCNSPTESSSSIAIPDINEVCENQYSEVDGLLISCTENCSFFGENCYHDYDIELLNELKINNESLSGFLLLEIGNQEWIDGRLRELILTGLEIVYISENFNYVSCQIHVSDSELCPDYVNGCDVCYGDIGRLDLWGECYVIEETDSLELSNDGHLGEEVPNYLFGEIPNEIGSLTNLTYLNLRNNAISGEIPPEIGNLTNLSYLDLGSNQLTGEIPPEIGNLTNLKHLSLVGNQLTGEIPSEIGNLTNLEELHLHK